MFGAPMNKNHFSTSSLRLSALRSAALQALVLLTITYPAAGQSSAGPVSPPAGQPIQQPQSPQTSIRVKVDLVSMPAVVHNSKGALVLDLDKKDFRIFDDGVEQRLEDFEIGGAPISLAIVVETSSRIEALLPAMRRTGILFTQTVVGADGDATVIGYNDQVDKLLDFTADEDAIEGTIKNLQQGTSGAKLYDALAEAVTALRSRPDSSRRVIVVLGEAVDTGSEDKLGRVLRDAQQSNIVIYSVGLSSTAAEVRGPTKQPSALSATPPGTFGLPPAPGTIQTPDTQAANTGGDANLLALAVWTVQHVTAPIREHPLELATIATGGLYESTLRDDSIEPAINSIGGELHAQYTLTYRPVGVGTSGYHEIRVQVRPRGLKVRSRPGYYVESPAN
jgi:VWFA-related protein